MAAESFFELILTGRQREYLLKLVAGARSYGADAKQKPEVRQLLELARPTDLPPHPVDWVALEEEAARRGGSLADLAFDKAKGKEG